MARTSTRRSSTGTRSSTRTSSRSGNRSGQANSNSTTNHLYNDVIGLASTLLRSRKDYGSEKIIGLAEATRQYADELGDIPNLQTYATSAADQMEALAEYVSDNSIEDMAEDATEFAKRYPFATLGFAVAAGYGLTRMITASSSTFGGGSSGGNSGGRSGSARSGRSSGRSSASGSEDESGVSSSRGRSSTRGGSSSASARGRRSPGMETEMGMQGARGQAARGQAARSRAGGNGDNAERGINPDVGNIGRDNGNVTPDVT